MSYNKISLKYHIFRKYKIVYVLTPLFLKLDYNNVPIQFYKNDDVQYNTIWPY